MRSKAIFWLALVCIAVVCWLDYQFFNEGFSYKYNALQRQSGHLAVLAIILPLGYLGWTQHPAKWPRRLWTMVYMIIICLVILIGAIQWETGWFGVGFLDNVSSLRLFFSSPLPYLLLFLLARLTDNNQT